MAAGGGEKDGVESGGGLIIPGDVESIPGDVERSTKGELETPASLVRLDVFEGIGGESSPVRVFCDHDGQELKPDLR